MKKAPKKSKPKQNSKEKVAKVLEQLYTGHPIFRQ